MLSNAARLGRCYRRVIAVPLTVHPRAMPVILTTPAEVDRWLEADTPDALGLQRPLPAGALHIVAKGEKEDGQTASTLHP